MRMKGNGLRLNFLKVSCIAPGWASLTVGAGRGSVSEVSVLTVSSLGVVVTCFRKKIRAVHSLTEFLEVDSLISIDVQSSDYSNDFTFRSMVSVQAAEACDVVERKTSVS